jgi:hypothetical protein
MYQIMVRESELPWADLGMPGVSMKVLHKDEATGAMAVLTWIEAGASIPAHWHSKADETVFVLNGDFVEAGTPGESQRCDVFRGSEASWLQGGVFASVHAHLA